MTEYVTKDSGKRARFNSGMQRDTEDGKPRFDLMLPLGVPYEEQFITRLAALYARGSVKYDDRNWEKADSEVEMNRMKSSAFRHFMEWMAGEDDEDHAAAVAFNLNAYETTKYKVDKAAEQEKVTTRDESWALSVEGEMSLDAIALMTGSFDRDGGREIFLTNAWEESDEPRAMRWVEDCDAEHGTDGVQRSFDRPVDLSM